MKICEMYSWVVQRSDRIHFKKIEITSHAEIHDMGLNSRLHP